MKGKFTSKDVKGYYDRLNRKYLDIYGDVIQAFRPKKTRDLLDYIIKSAGIKWKMDLLDAGCGVCGPAIHFAKQMNTSIEAVTISEEQLRVSRQKIAEHRQEDKINVIAGDFHQLDELYKGRHFDGILFLESLGHAERPAAVIRSAAGLLNPGGFIYIKDFFRRTTYNEKEQRSIDQVIENMNANYNYNTLDLIPIITELRMNDLSIEFIKKFDFQDDTGVRARFEKDQGIDNFDGEAEFNPAEWLEIKVVRE